MNNGEIEYEQVLLSREELPKSSSSENLDEAEESLDDGAIEQGDEYIPSEQEFSSENSPEREISSENPPEREFSSEVLLKKEREIKDNPVEVEPKIIKVGANLKEALGLILFLVFGCYVFYIYLPELNYNSNITWPQYTKKCCDNIFNMTRCSIHDDNKCYTKFTIWLKSINENLTSSIVNKCCYWFTSYNNYRLQALPYCDKFCLLS